MATRGYLIPKPMDLILCSGEAFISKRIIWFNKLVGIKGPAQQISHIAQMTWGERVIESTTLNKWCNKTGVQANKWDKWLKNYDGKVWIRRFPINKIYAGSEALVDRILEKSVHDFDMRWLATPYENGIPGYWELIKAGLGIGVLNPTTNIHCSEIVTMKMKMLGYLPENLQNYILSPAQYCIGGKFDKLSSEIWEPPERVK